MELNFKEIIDQIVRVKQISREKVISVVKKALEAAVEKKLGNEIDVEIMYDDETGELSAFLFREVVEKVENKLLEISLEEARELEDESVSLGDTLGIQMDNRELGRIAAQAAKQKLVEEFKSIEADVVYEEFKDRQGEIITGSVRRDERNGTVVDVGKSEAFLPYKNKIPGERFKVGSRIKAYISRIEKTKTHECNIILSRDEPLFLVKLFELEVPEIAEGIVTIEGVARDPGHRSKISVRTHDSDVDPVGACVGMKGSRIQNIVHELSGEKIDIVPWHPDPVKYICNTLSPVDVAQILIEEEEKSMDVIVPDDQLSIAIGKGGENVRLASQLTGWNIDIQSESQMKMMQNEAKRRLLYIEDVDESLAESLIKLGYTTLEDLAGQDPETLAELPDLTIDEAKNLIKEVKGLLESGPSVIELDKEIEEKLDVPVTSLDCVNEEMGLMLNDRGYYTLVDIQSEPDTKSFAENAHINIRRARQIRYSLQLFADNATGRDSFDRDTLNPDDVFDFSRLEEKDDGSESDENKENGDDKDKDET